MNRVFEKTSWNKPPKPDLPKLYKRTCKSCKSKFKTVHLFMLYCKKECLIEAVRNDIKSQKEKKYTWRPSSEGKRYRNKCKIKRDLKATHGKPHCQECKRSVADLELHHIIFRSSSPWHKHINHIRNGILLCRECHVKAHAHKEEYQGKRVNERNLYELFPDILHDRYKE